MAWQHVALGMALALFDAHHVRADWQYTRWGMSPEEIVELSKGKAVPIPDPPDNVEQASKAKLLESSIEVDQIPLNIGFIFDLAGRTLAAVGLVKQECTPAEAYRLERQLLLKYGNPVVQEGALTTLQRTSWRSQENGDIISLIILFDWNDKATCTIRYEPPPRGL